MARKIFSLKMHRAYSRPVEYMQSANILLWLCGHSGLSTRKSQLSQLCDLEPIYLVDLGKDS
jgi:hypothetical protein